MNRKVYRHLALLYGCSCPPLDSDFGKSNKSQCLPWKQCTFILSHIHPYCSNLSLSASLLPPLLSDSTLLWIKCGGLQTVSCLTPACIGRLFKVCVSGSFWVWAWESLRLSPPTAVQRKGKEMHLYIHYFSHL